MKYLLTNTSYTLFLCTLMLVSCATKTDKTADNIITSDIDNFWEAYDKIVSTSDSTEQVEYLKTLFLDKGSIGLEKMMEARNYTTEEYLQTIHDYPKFWSSVREEMFKAKSIQLEMEAAIQKLKSLYPELKPAKIYYTVGALRSNGTVMDSCVLIGSELAFANKDVPTEEFPDYLSHLRTYFDSEPGNGIVFLNIHEYVHTQQKTTIGDHLLAQTVCEGVAEFVAEKALKMESPNPQIQYGRDNDVRVKARFEEEMFSPNVYNWIWNSADNEFGMRDLGYYVGYRICKGYYQAADDKSLAIKEMIELDYNNEEDLI